MTKKIFHSTILVTLFVFIISTVFIFGAVYDYFLRGQQNRIRYESKMIARAVEGEGETYLQEIDGGTHRITWIDSDGAVLYDNRVDPAAMENHKDREEVKQAMETGYGESSRKSSTLMRKLLYAACRLDDGTVIRISAEEKSVPALMLSLFQPILLVAVLAVVLSFLLSSLAARRIVQPLNQLDLDDPLSNEAYDELSPLFRRIDSQQRELKTKEKTLLARKQEFDTVTSNMSEGLTLLGSKGEIISMNEAAKRIFGASDDSIGKNALEVNRSLELQDALKTVSQGKRAEKILSVAGSSYQMAAEPVFDEGKAVSGVVILLYDITDKQKAEIMRREFTANVSHELKTPLQTISGCAELLMNHMVKEGDVERFQSAIYRESRRMISLVEDIISLSRLDEYCEVGRAEPVDILALARETISVFQNAPDDRKLSLRVEGDSAVIRSVPRLVWTLLRNICDNAVKYNREGGKVLLRVQKKEGGGALLTVKDTGIGIPPEDLDRIFERFYRVDKSRSEAGGGTGLGLSIVKHAAEIIGADVSVKSEVGKGTEVRVSFPATLPQEA